MSTKMKKLLILLIFAFYCLACSERKYFYPDTIVSSTEIFSNWESYIGKKIKVMGYIANRHADEKSPHYVLLPSEEYMQLSDMDRFRSSIWIEFRDEELFYKLPEKCESRFVSVKGELGEARIGAMLALKNVEWIATGGIDDQEHIVCYPELKMENKT